MKKDKIFRSLVWPTLVIFIVTLSQSAAPVQANPGNASFSFDPSTTNVQQGDIFTVNIKVDASSQPLDGAQAYINFDPNYLRVVDTGGTETNQISNGELYNNTWPDVLVNAANNSTGQIDYAAGKGTGGSSVNTIFTLATIRFKAITQTGGTPTALIFNASAPRATKAAYGLDTVTSIITNGTVTITPPSDTTPPSPVNNLAVTNPTSTSLTLTWSAPGDDGTSGTAAQYLIRYSQSSSITDNNTWNAATPVAGVPAPNAAGTNERHIVTGLNPSITYYFALIAVDDAGNPSPLSNSPQGTTTEAMGRMIGPGLSLNVVDINLADPVRSLGSITVRILVPQGSVFSPPVDLAALSATDDRAGVVLYKDNKTEGYYGDFDPFDDFRDIYLPLASTPTWTQSGNTYETTLTLANPDVLPVDDTGNNAGDDYFVVLNTSDSPPPGATFRVQIPAQGITMDGVTGPDSATPATPDLITVAEGGMIGSSVLISEIQTAGATASDEFIELYNRSDYATDLSSFSIQYNDGANTLSASSSASQKNLSGVIPANSFFLIANSDGYDGAKAADVTYTNTDFSLSASGGTVFLVDNQTALTSPGVPAVQDRVAWGSGTLYAEGTPASAPASDGSIERKSFPESTISSMTTGIDVSMGNAFDSDDNLNDFIVRTTADPQNTTDTESSEMSGVNPVVINEVYYDNTGSDQQWIELYNNAGTPEDISGWKILAANKTYIIPASTSIGAGGYIVVHWNYGDPANNTATNLYTGTAGMAAMATLAGDVFLTDEGDGAKDYVEYGAGGQTSESIAGGSQWPAGDHVPGVLQGQSIGRGNNGYDTNKASDWQSFTSPTIGAMNAGGDSFAPDPVTSVALSDNDATNFGLDGEDVTVTWTPATTPDATFDKYVMYLLPAATNLDTFTHTPFAQVFGGQSVSSFTASPSKIKDSAGNNLTDGSYKAYVMAVDMALNKSSAVASAAATLTAETSAQAGDDTDPPMIMSMPAWMAKAGADIIILASVYDNRELDATTPVQLKWRLRGPGAFSAITGAEVDPGTGLYRLALPWDAGWNTSTQIDYYLVAKDVAGNYTYFTTSPAFDTDPNSHDAADETTADTYYFTVSFAPAAGYNRTISGTAYDSAGAPLNGTGIMIPGSGLDVVVTGAGGTYSFTVADGNYSIAAGKAGYMEGWIDGVSVNAGNTASTGNDFYLSEGFFGVGGDAEKAFVRWTDPFDGMMGAPIDINLNAAPIVAHMSEPMDSSAITDTNATDAGSNVFLTTTGQDRVAGQVTYDETDPGDPKIIFYSSTALSKGSTYFFVITSAVTDLAGNSIEGNQPDGRYVAEFTTFSDITGGTYGQGIAFPPFVTGSMPAPGSFNVPTDSKITVLFSEPMDPSTIEATNSTGLNIRVYDPNYQGTMVGQYVTLASVTLDDATNTVATLIRGDGGLLDANHHYEIRVLGGAKSMKGIYMADPSQAGFEGRVVYRAEFDTGSDVDTSGAPQIVGTNLEMYRQTATGDISVAGTLVDVPVNLGVIEIGFNKDIDPATITRTTITLKVGTTLVKGSVSYKPLDRVATFSPSLALNPNTTYTLKVLGGSNGIADIVGGAGHYLASDYYAVFTTSSQADAQPPFVAFANASDFKIAITLSEPMNAAKRTNTAQWSSSVLNPANYTLRTDTGPPEMDPTGSPYTGNNVTTGNLSEAQGLAIKYDGETYTINIEGLQFSPMGGFRIWVNNVTDLSGNVIEGNIAAPNISAFGRNAAGGPIGSSAQGGMMGPGSKGMTGPGGAGMDMGTMGMMPVGVFPMSMIAGATTTYMIDMPLSRAIPSGGTIVLTFPSGFNISGAKNADPDGTWVHQDINGPGPGIVVLGNAAESPQSGGLNNDGVTVNTSARTVTITLGSVGTAGYQTGGDTADDNDFIHLEIAGIKNSNIPKSFETSGYTVDIKTMAGGSLLESISSMPFFITEAGQYTISGTITFPNSVTTASGESIYIFGGSPMVGPIDIDVSFTNSATANYSITGLPAGEYMIMTEPMVTITGGVGDGEYFGSGIPEPIWIDDTTTTGDIYTKNFTFTSSTGKPGLTVKIIGDFSGDKAGDIDIFAGSPGGFSVKTVTLNTTYTAQSPFSTTLYLPSTGSYMVGMGPAMPKGPMTMGPPPMPKWTPPPPVDVSYDGTNWTETSDTPNDGIILFTLGTALAVTGHVLDGAGNPIPNVEVYAYSPMGMFGTHASSLPDGSFTLYLPEGMYKAGAFLPGMPPSGEIGIDVRIVSGETKVYIDGVETADIIIRIAKPDRTISGKVTDGTNTISGASVYTYRTDGPGHAEAMTDSSGVYILYVTPGTWNVGAFLPGYGPLPEKTGIEVTTDDKANINFFPEAGVTYVKISGNVSIGGVAQTYIPIRAVEVAANGSFTGYENGASTDSSGNYSIKVKGTSSGEKHYRVDIWTPDYGEVAANSGSGVTNTPTPAQPWNVAVTTNDVTDVNIAVGSADLKTLTISFTGGSSTMNAYVAVERVDPTSGEPLGMGRHFEIKDLTGTTTVSLPAGAYHAFAHIPGYGEFIPTEGQNPPYYLDLTSDTTGTFDLSGIGEATVSGTVYDGQGNPIPDSFVHVGNPQTGMQFGTPSDSSGNYSLAIKPGTYMIGAEKPGYISEPTTIIVSAGANTQDLTITKTSLTVSGYVYADANSNGSYDSGEELPFAFVYAEKLGGGFAGTPAEPDGSYTLYVTPGDWRLFGVAEGYQEKAYTGNPVTVESESVSGVNILLSDTVSLTSPKAKPFKPASGATFDDPNSGLKITLPPMALGSETTDYQIQGKETSSLPSTPSAVPLGGKGKKVSIFDASGNPVTTLNDDITIEMTYTKAEMVAAGFPSLEEVAKIKMAYWDDSASSYVTIPTTIAYDPASGTTWANLVSVTFKGTTSHLTVFSPILPADALAPASPTNLAAVASSGQVSLTWTAPTTNADGSALTDLLGYEMYRATGSATGTYTQVNTSDITGTQYTDTTVTNGTTYYYKVTSADTGGNESVKSDPSNAATPGVDSTNPTLSSSVPADNATGVAVSANIVLNFSEAVDAESGNITIKLTSDDSTFEQIDVTDTNKVTGSGTSQITINPAGTFASSTGYYVLIDATAFDDASGNSYAGISQKTTLNFTAADTTNPTLSSSVPADNATGVAVSANIVLNFSEAVDAESGNITIKLTSNDSTFEQIDVTDTDKVTGSGTSQITINPAGTFASSTGYYVLIDATAFDDASGNSYAGISQKTTLNFTAVTPSAAGGGGGGGGGLPTEEAPPTSEELEQLPPEEAAEQLEQLTPEEAGATLEGMSSDSAGGALENMTPELAGGALENMTPELAGGALENMAPELAGGALENMAPELAGDAMEQVTTETLSDVIPAMDETSLTERLPELSPDKLYSIPLRVLFDSLPNAPTEQLTGEVAPQPAAGLSDPIVRYTTPGEAQYVAIRTVAGEWVVVVGTPPPVEKLLIKTRRALENVETNLQISEDLPLEVTLALPEEQISRAYLVITFGNAAPEDIELGHITFYVEKEWLEQNSIPKWSVALHRYDPELSQWTSLPTKRVKEDDSKIYYSATITHFSALAISGSQTLPPVNFKVSNLSINPAEAETGEAVTISVDITNISGKDGTYAATLWINSTAETGNDFTLPANTIQTVFFVVTRATAGNYDVRIDRQLGSFSVTGAAVAPAPPPPAPLPAPPVPIPLAPASFTLSQLVITPAEVDIGQSVTISALITNTGDITGTYEAILKVNDAVVATKEVILSGGTSQTVTFTTSSNVSRTYTVSIENLSGTFTVKAEVEAEVEAPPLNRRIIGIISAAVVVVGVLIFLITRRRRVSSSANP